MYVDGLLSANLSRVNHSVSNCSSNRYWYQCNLFYRTIFQLTLVHDLNFPSEHRSVQTQRGNATETADEKPGKVAILVGISAAALLLCFLLLLLLLRHKQRKKAARQNSREDQCPVYGMYYFADGVHIDGGDSEVVDRNVNYAAA